MKIIVYIIFLFVWYFNAYTDIFIFLDRCLSDTRDILYFRYLSVVVFSRDRDKYRFYACILRARFDENKNEKDMMKATMMLKEGEEEFWANQHPQPYIFPDSPGGTSYERYECYKVRQMCFIWIATTL